MDLLIKCSLKRPVGWRRSHQGFHYRGMETLLTCQPRISFEWTYSPFCGRSNLLKWNLSKLKLAGFNPQWAEVKCQSIGKVFQEFSAKKYSEAVDVLHSSWVASDLLWSHGFNIVVAVMKVTFKGIIWSNGPECDNVWTIIIKKLLASNYRKYIQKTKRNNLQCKLFLLKIFTLSSIDQYFTIFIPHYQMLMLSYFYNFCQLILSYFCNTIGNSKIKSQNNFKTYWAVTTIQTKSAQEWFSYKKFSMKLRLWVYQHHKKWKMLLTAAWTIVLPITHSLSDKMSDPLLKLNDSVVLQGFYMGAKWNFSQNAKFAVCLFIYYSKHKEKDLGKSPN